MAVGSGGQLGYKSWLGVAEETSWSVKCTATSFLEFNTESLERKRERKKLETINTSRNSLVSYLGNEVNQGSIECPVNVGSDAIIKLIKNAMAGTATSGGTSTTGYIHQFFQGSLETSLTSLTIQKRVGDTHIFDMMGCRVNSFTLKGDDEGAVSFAAEVIGRQGSTSSDTISVALTGITPLLWDGINFKTGETASMTSVLASGATEYIKGFEFTYNNNLIADESARSLGTTTVDFVKHGKAEASLKFSQRFDTSTAYDRAFAKTAYGFGLLLGSSQTIGAGVASTTYAMSLEIPKGYYGTQTPKVSDAGVVVQEIEILAEASSAGADVVNMKVTNATVSY